MSPVRATRHQRTAGAGLACATLLLAGAASAAPPAWLQAQVGAALPAHDDKTAAVVLYSETLLNAAPGGRLRRVDRRVYRILRSDGAERGTVFVPFTPRSRVTDLHAWCIPATGKGYEVRNRDAYETALGGIAGSELITDVRARVLQIPAALPGSIVGYELERELEPYLLADEWVFQDTVPVREARYSLELPPGWEYHATWLNHAEEPPQAAGRSLQWVVHDVSALHEEPRMPPWQQLAGRVWISFTPAGRPPAVRSWQDLGSWYLELARGRRDASPEIRQKVAELTAGTPQLLERMRAVARFVQSDVRYVAIELGISGLQPRAAAEVFAHRYGDCKDKVTLLSSMLRELGVDSTYLIVDSERGAVSASTPPNLGFDHVILAIVLPEAVHDPALLALLPHPQLGRLLLFDPTDPYTPLGALPGQLQGGYGLLVTPAGGELVQLPQLPGSWSGVQRVAHLTLDTSGALHGEVQEMLSGDPAAHERQVLASERLAGGQTRIAETHLGDSLADFRLLRAEVSNVADQNLPVEWSYRLDAERYAKRSGELVVVRPRVLGVEASRLLETPEPRQNPVEFDAAVEDADLFEIEVPVEYQLDDLPPPVDLDYGFAAYHSRTEFAAHVLRYRRTFELRALSVPTARVGELRQLYRSIAADERAAAVLKRAAPAP